jgi:hypothetical protein
MPARILDRYTRDENGRYVLEISANSVQALYSQFDRHAPYVKKELDPELIDYIVESVREIGNAPFAIQFRVAEAADGELQARVTASIQNYFLYLADLASRELRRLMWHAFVFLVAGVVILALSVYANRFITGEESVVTRVMAEGLTVAAWVALWEALATFLLNWAPSRRTIEINQRIARAPLRFTGPGGHDVSTTG